MVCLLDAIKIAERLGTWVIYEVRDAKNLDYLIGWMLYRIDDIERMRGRSNATHMKAHYSEQIGYWRRAVRWVLQLDRAAAGKIAEALIERIESNPRYQQIPYVAPGCEHPSLRPHDKPPRRAGRPRTTVLTQERELPRCEDCGRVTL